MTDSTSSRDEIDRETVGMLLGAGAGIMVGATLESLYQSSLGLAIGGLFILSGLVYEAYQRTMMEANNVE